MVEAPARSPSTPGVAGGPGPDAADAADAADALVVTKLRVPGPPRAFVPRPRLAARLAADADAAGGLTLVCAPAGCGKTALLADWVRHSPWPAAWLALDAGDNDAGRFWRHVVAALAGARPGLGAQVVAQLRAPQPPPLEAVLAGLLNELAALPDPLVLVLDDYHVVEEPRIHASLAYLLEHRPPALRVALASRADPPLPLARWRARGQLAELRAADLRFLPEEAASLLGALAGADLPPAAAAALEARTEGWAAGLQLAGLSLRGRAGAADVAGFVATFTGSHRYVLDYLSEEVLARLPERWVRFLLETSVLERLSGPLCDAVTGGAGGQEVLEALERANLFLVPLDEVRGWWRYHQLFADLLRARLLRADPARAAALHGKAAAWCERHGPPDEAVRHALAAGDAGWAARLVEQHAQARFVRGETATVQRWLAALPGELVRRRPRLGIAKAVWAFMVGRVDEVEPALADVERATAGRASGPPQETVAGAAEAAKAARAPRGHANVPAMLAILRAELARQRGDPDRTIAFAERARAHVGGDDRLLRSLVGWNLGAATLMQGRAARRRGPWPRSPPSTGRPARPTARCGPATPSAGPSAPRAGSARPSRPAGRRSRPPPGRPKGRARPRTPPTPVAGVAHVGLAEVLRERGDLGAALDHATEGVRLCRQLGSPEWLGTSLTALAWARQARGDQAGARAAIDEAERALPGSDAVADWNVPAAAQRARLALARGEVAGAAGWAVARGLDADDAPGFAREREYLVLARVLLAQGAPQRALGLLRRLHELAAGQGRTGSLIEVRALQALALAGSGDEAGALHALVDALALAAPEGYVAVFVDEGPAAARLLDTLAAAGQRRRLAAAGVPPEYLRRLGARSSQVGPTRRAAVAGGAPERHQDWSSP